MGGECIVCKTDFGLEKWSRNEIFGLGRQSRQDSLGLYDDTLDDREHRYIYKSHLDKHLEHPSGGSEYRLLWTGAG
jgi:hypothetical protein